MSESQGGVNTFAYTNNSPVDFYDLHRLVGYVPPVAAEGSDDIHAGRRNVRRVCGSSNRDPLELIVGRLTLCRSRRRNLIAADANTARRNN